MQLKYRIDYKPLGDFVHWTIAYMIGALASEFEYITILSSITVTVRNYYFMKCERAINRYTRQTYVLKNGKNLPT